MFMPGIQTRAGEFTQIINDIALDHNNIVKTIINFDPPRPLRKTDNVLHSIFAGNDFDAVDILCYEDAGMATGAFLGAQSLCYEVSGELDALANARKAFQGIKYIYRLGCQKKEGFFPKPYGSNFSTHMSRDQYIFAMSGLSHYYRIAQHSEKAEIRRMITYMAAYWIDIDYRVNYFQMPASSHLKDYIAGLFLGLIHMPYSFGGGDRFKIEFKRLIEEEKLGLTLKDTLRAKYRRGEKYDGGTYFRQNENPSMLKCLAIDYLWDADLEHRDLYIESLENLVRDDLFFELSDEDGLNYCLTGYDPETDQRFLTSPGIIKELDNPLNLSFQTWGGLRKRAGSTQTAFSAFVVAARLDKPEIAQKAYDILTKLSLDKFKGITVSLPEHIPPGRGFEKDILISSYICYWLYAFWLGEKYKNKA